MPPKSAAEKAIPPTQDYPPNASSSYPAPCCVSRMDIPVAHLPRDVGLQHIAPFSTKEKEKAKEKKNEKGGEGGRGRSPYGVLRTQVLAEGRLGRAQDLSGENLLLSANFSPASPVTHERPLPCDARLHWVSDSRATPLHKECVRGFL